MVTMRANIAEVEESQNSNGHQELTRRIAEKGDWFHNINLNGVWTAPHHFLGDFPNVKWKHIAPALPADLSGATVLDVGCNGGFHSIELKKRGASRVLGVDVDDRYLDQARFASQTLGLDIEFAKCSVYDVDSIPGQFDYVLFMGVFYHLRYPLFALDKVIKKVKGSLIFQTMVRGSSPVPSCAKIIISGTWRYSRIRIFPACILLRRTMRAIPQTGGSRITGPWKGCCAAQAWKSPLILNRKPGFARPHMSPRTTVNIFWTTN